MFGVALLLSPSARAELAVVGLEYRATGDCPAREAFVRELEARTERVRTAESGAQGTLFVEVAGGAGTVRAELLYREAGGRETVRTIAGPNCDDVVRALALIAAVLVDPEALTGAPPLLAPPTDEPESLAARAAPPPSAPRAARPVVAPDSPSAPEEGSGRSAEARWRFGAGASAAWHAGSAPNPAIGFAIEANAERRRRGAFGVVLGLTFQHSESDPLETAAGEAEFTWTAGRIWACPLRWPALGRASLAACAAFEGGVLTGRGFNTVGGEEQSGPWLAPGAFGRAELRPLEFLAFTLDAGAVVPIIRDAFYFDPEIQAFRAPAVAGFAALGVRFQAE